MNVLVYSGAETSSASLHNTIISLKTILSSNYAVQTVTPQALSDHPWAATCALLAVPSLSQGSGASTGGPMGASATKGILNYLSRGGALLSIGTGVRMAPPRPRSVLPLSDQIGGLSLSSSFGGGAVTPGSKITLEDESSGLTFTLVPTTVHTASKSDVQLTADETSIAGIGSSGEIDVSSVPDLEKYGANVLARQTSPEASVVGVKARMGRGTAVFWSAQLDTPIPDDAAADARRLAALSATLTALGLNLPAAAAPSTLPRPLPQVLTAAPWRTGVVERILSSLEIPTALGDNEKGHELADSNDTFLFHASEHADRVFADARAWAATSGDDPATWSPKHVVAYGGDARAPVALTPQFDLGAYYDALKAEREACGCRKVDAEGWAAGEAVLYGEVVTSTQTMLDKNRRLLQSLPTPLLSLASAQLTGRGRGANVWLSPPGCLMFSLLLRAPAAQVPASKIVFVQYLAALALADACRAEGVLGPRAGAAVRIKWPNDIYAVMPDGERRKIGGILVNTSYGANGSDIVVGCGLNVLNAPPITSLAQLLPTSGAGTDSLPPTMERTLAATMARFATLWDEFLAARGSFAPFMDRYLELWLHSDQPVTLTTLTPPRRVRIVGITLEYGLLRTVAEPAPGSGRVAAGPEYIDLQPDGNSFDLMAGLIKTKT